MSCFIAPLAQAIATSACKRHFIERSTSVWTAQLPVLEKMLWGGSLVLIVDHIIHGEFLTFNLRELLTVGVPMSAVVTAVWVLLVLRKSKVDSTAVAKCQKEKMYPIEMEVSNSCSQQ